MTNRNYNETMGIEKQTAEDVIRFFNDVDLYTEGMKINNKEEKQTKLNKELRNYEDKVHSILYPEKEGRRNFRNLDGEKKEEINEQYPLFRKNPETKEWEYRTYLGYFENEEEGKYMVCSSYAKVSSGLAVLYCAACYGFAAYIIVKEIMKKIKK